MTRLRGRPQPGRSGFRPEMSLWSIYAYTDPQAGFRTRSQVIKKGTGEAPGAW